MPFPKDGGSSCGKRFHRGVWLMCTRLQRTSTGRIRMWTRRTRRMANRITLLAMTIKRGILMMVLLRRR
jgi:hypothetical protein